VSTFRLFAGFAFVLAGGGCFLFAVVASRSTKVNHLGLSTDPKVAAIPLYGFGFLGIGLMTLTL
jgi:hypothetical protein